MYGKDKYPWLDDSDERKHMTEKYWINTLALITSVQLDVKRKR